MVNKYTTTHPSGRVAHRTTIHRYEYAVWGTPTQQKEEAENRALLASKERDIDTYERELATPGALTALRGAQLVTKWLTETRSQAVALRARIQAGSIPDTHCMSWHSTERLARTRASELQREGYTTHITPAVLVDF